MSDKPAIKLVILDMDGLLIDSEPYWQETERRIFRNYGLEITEEMQKSTFGLRTDEQISHWYAVKPWDNPDFESIEKEYNRIIKGFFEEEAELMEGAQYILDFFQKKNIPMALASSSSMELINAFVKRFGLENYFSLLNSAEEEQFGKPHPAVYLATAKKMKIDPIHALAFEDSVNGVIAARAARMRVVAIPDSHHYDYPDYGVASLKIPSLLKFTEPMFLSI